jgi:hypothetical protein
VDWINVPQVRDWCRLLWKQYWAFIFRNRRVISWVAERLISHSWSWALLEKPPIVQLLKNFPAVYGIQRFITVITRALLWSVSWDRLIQSIQSHHIFLRFILILSTHLRLGPSSLLFTSGFPTNIFYTFLFSPFVLHALSISSPWLDHSSYTWRRVQVMKLLIMQLSD